MEKRKNNKPADFAWICDPLMFQFRDTMLTLVSKQLEIVYANAAL